MSRKCRKTSYEERLEIVFKVERGLSHRKIASEMKIHRNLVNGIVKKHQESGTVEDRERSGRPKISTAGDDRIFIRTSLADRRLTAPQLREEWVQSTGVEASVSTVTSRLSAAGLRGCVATKKPLLTPLNRRARLEFAKQYQHWTVSDWEKVLWSDESSFEVFNSARKVFVRRRTNERYRNKCVVPTVKGGGGQVMVWGCMSEAGVGLVCRVDGTVN